MEEKEFERHVMDCLIIARSRKGEGRKDLQELLPVHKDLLAFIEAYTTRKEIEVLSKVEGDDDGYAWYVDSGNEQRLDEHIIELKAKLNHSEGDRL